MKKRLGRKGLLSKSRVWDRLFCGDNLTQNNAFLTLKSMLEMRYNNVGIQKLYYRASDCKHKEI